MPGLRDIKRRIKSVKNTQQITKAMKMVSAAKLRRAQEDIEAARPYAEKMRELTLSLASKTSPESHPLLAERKGVELGIFLITSDRGLCGSFNTVLIRTAENFMEEKKGLNMHLSLAGKRAVEHFKKSGMDIIEAAPVGSGRPEYGTARARARKLISMFLKEELDEVYLIYSEFISALSQRPVVQRLLPVTTEEKEKEEAPGIEAIYEPSVDAVLASLLPRYVEVQVFRAFLESAASEHGARMTAMDSASRNAAEMIDSLTLRFNRLRQAAITKELMEIIGGSEALKG